MIVRAYVNLHKSSKNKVVYSIQAKTDKGWRVVGHTDKLVLRNVRFHVREGGRQRVLREGRKNVHAFVEGEPSRIGRGRLSRVSYNPYRGPLFFVKKTGQITQNANYVVLKGNGVFAISPH